MEQWSKHADRPFAPDYRRDERDIANRELEQQAVKRRHREAQRRKALDDALDRGLEDTFPGSDPVAIVQPPPSARDKHGC